MALKNVLNNFLQREISYYVNTPKESEYLNMFMEMYSFAKSYKDTRTDVSPLILNKYRKAYKGILKALKKGNVEGDEPLKQLRKICFELVESQVDSSIPYPKMMPRKKRLMPVVQLTENYLKFELDRAITERLIDKSERAVPIDGTGWYKVSWDSLDSSHTSQGNVKLDFYTADQVTPQPNIDNFKMLEYIFLEEEVSTTRLKDLYNRNIMPYGDSTNTTKVISCYYLNENHVVGLFMFSYGSQQVICNEKDWQIRKIRKCVKCGSLQPSSEVCPICESTSFKYYNAEHEILSQDLYDVYTTVDEEGKTIVEQKLLATKGTKVPFYQLKRLPFVPRVNISQVEGLYGLSDISIMYDNQDSTNKVLTKMEEKIRKSRTYITEPNNKNLPDDDRVEVRVKVNSPNEAAMFTVKDVSFDISKDIAFVDRTYQYAKVTSGITESYQGQSDSSAVSGKAKQVAATQTAGRLESKRQMKAAAFADLYEIMWQTLLAFSDLKRSFIKLTPEGEEIEQEWNKHLFLNVDSHGQLYYDDDFAFSIDAASSLSQDRQQMWNLLTQNFLSGTLGNPQDPRVLKLYWNTLAEYQYPLAKTILAGITANEQHLPPEIEQLLMQNPQVVELAVELLNKQGKNTTAASSSGSQSRSQVGSESGMTHRANEEKTNITNAMKRQGGYS